MKILSLFLRGPHGSVFIPTAACRGAPVKLYAARVSVVAVGSHCSRAKTGLGKSCEIGLTRGWSETGIGRMPLQSARFDCSADDLPFGRP